MIALVFWVSIGTVVLGPYDSGFRFPTDQRTPSGSQP